MTMASELLALEGEPTAESTIRHMRTLDGDGIVFVTFDGTIHPGGLLPVPLGNIRTTSLVRAYRDDSLLRGIRARNLKGSCGLCEFRFVCGGSRARAYAHEGDPLASDPACPLVSWRPEKR